MDRKVSLDALHYLLMVWKCEGIFAEAARQLNVSPSAVSQAMGKLEKKYGELFMRDADGVKLTKVGKLLHDSAETAILGIRIAEGRIQDMRASKAASETLKIAFSPSHLGTVMNALGVVLEERKGLTVTTEEGEPATVAELLRKAEGPELGIAYFQAPERHGLKGPKIPSRQLALVTNRKKNPHLVKLDSVHAEDLKKEPLALLEKGPVRKLLNEYFRGQFPKRVLLQSNMVASLLAATRNGFVSTILPEFQEDETFAVRRLIPAIMPPTYLLWNSRIQKTEAAVAFAEAVARLVPST